MKEFFASMDTSLQVYWYIAIGASIFFIIQTVMSFVSADVGGDVGMDGHADIHTDGSGDHPFQLFSLRNLINFSLGFGWAGVAFYDTIENKIWLGLLAVAVGIVFILVFFLIMKSLIKLAEDNTFKLEATVGLIADVYMTIPPAREGKGKVLVSVSGSTHELTAVTTYREALKSGMSVKVTAIEGDTLVVMPNK